MVGTTAALFCALFGGINIVCVHALTGFTPEQLLLNSSVAGLVTSFLVFPFDEKSQIFHSIHEVNFGKLIPITEIGLISMFLFFQGAFRLNPTIFSMIRSCEIIFTFLLQAFVNKDIPSNLTLVGGGCVIFSAIFVGLEDAVRRRVPYETLKKYL